MQMHVSASVKPFLSKHENKLKKRLDRNCVYLIILIDQKGQTEATKKPSSDKQPTHRYSYFFVMNNSTIEL